MVFQLQRKLAFKGFSGRHDSSINPFLQHPAIPVIRSHHPKQNPILRKGEHLDKIYIKNTKQHDHNGTADSHPVCVWRSQSGTSPDGTSSHCSPVYLKVDIMSVLELCHVFSFTPFLSLSSASQDLTLPIAEKTADDRRFLSHTVSVHSKYY